MENSLLVTENILNNVRLFVKRNAPSRKELLEIKKTLDSIEKCGHEKREQQQRGITDEIVEVIVNTCRPDADVVGCVVWLTLLQHQQLLPHLEAPQVDRLVRWLIALLPEHAEDQVAYISLVAISGLLNSHTGLAGDYMLRLFGPDEITLLDYLRCSDVTESSYANLSGIVQCLDTILCALKGTDLTAEQTEICAQVADMLLQIHFTKMDANTDVEHVSLFVLSSLSVLHKVAVLLPDYVKQHMPELLGISKAYMRFGINGEAPLTVPQRVHMAQQSLYDSLEAEEITESNTVSGRRGKKISKTRKPRIVARGTRSIEPMPNGRRIDELEDAIVLDVKTSDSEVSEQENARGQSLHNRPRRAKVRLYSIALIGSAVRVAERRLLYGYWHVLFPNGSDEAHDDLIGVGLHDANARCRSAALQVASQLLYGSKNFLRQAEFNPLRCPTAFIPFSVSLGFTVLATYEGLAAILSRESSLPVLTQALKCLAVLVQATPFEQLKNGLVKRFLKLVKPLVYHRDVTIQVSALMVMEFLVATPELALDLAEAVGLPRINAKPESENYLSDEAIDLIKVEELTDSDGNESDEYAKSNATARTEVMRCDGTPWLVERVFHNLDVRNKLVVPAVRIESLQVLAAIIANFSLLDSHLERVTLALEQTLEDPLTDVRLHAARCINSCAYQISRDLLDKIGDSPASELTSACDYFWARMLPLIMKYIRREGEELPAIKISLCDALSNIGVVMFERLPPASQLGLLSFLSGVSNDNTEDVMVRAASVRAIAVYVLFPSVRNDMVFVENAAELTLHLATDSNLLVRIKAFWSMGNISDALIYKCADNAPTPQERISDQLLLKLITVAADACTDNDKVRCNAVRTLGNLLRLILPHYLNESSNLNWRQAFGRAIGGLTDCIRLAGNAKVKWNTCYAIRNLMRSQTIFSVSDMDWRSALYSAVCHLMVHHSNFKVRINAAAIVTTITDRSHFGTHFESFWSSLLAAIEQSNNLSNFQEYNHRDNLQEQLCLAVAHIVRCANVEDLPMLKKHLTLRVEVVRNTWIRVTNRMVPEKAALLLSCSILLRERLNLSLGLSTDQKNAILFLAENFSIP